MFVFDRDGYGGQNVPFGDGAEISCDTVLNPGSIITVKNR